MGGTHRLQWEEEDETRTVYEILGAASNGGRFFISIPKNDSGDEDYNYCLVDLNYCQLGVPLHLLQIPTMGADILKIMELHHLHQLIQHVVLVAVLEYVQVVAVKVENGEIQDIIPAVVANLGLPAQAVMVTSDALIAMEQEDISLMSFTAQSVGCSFAL